MVQRPGYWVGAKEVYFRWSFGGGQKGNQEREKNWNLKFREIINVQQNIIEIIEEDEKRRN